MMHLKTNLHEEKVKFLINYLTWGFPEKHRSFDLLHIETALHDIQVLRRSIVRIILLEGFENFKVYTVFMKDTAEGSLQ